MSSFECAALQVDFWLALQMAANRAWELPAFAECKLVCCCKLQPISNVDKHALHQHLHSGAGQFCLYSGHLCMSQPAFRVKPSNFIVPVSKPSSWQHFDWFLERRSAAGTLLSKARELLDQLPRDRANRVAELASKDQQLSSSSSGEFEGGAEQPEQPDTDAAKGKGVFSRAPRLYAPGRLLFLHRSVGEITDSNSFRVASMWRC